MNPFDFVNSICDTKKDLMFDTANDDLAEKNYAPYLVNKALSYFPDTILYCNELNLHHQVDNKLQYHYLLNSIRPRKRFAKWVKKQDSNDFEAVQEYYNYNNEKTAQALILLSKDQIDLIKKQLEKGS